MPITPTDVIWMDGKLVPWDSATVHITTHALHYGSSVFEGIRAYDRNGTASIFRLDDHIRRLYDSCKIYRMDIPFTPDEIKRACIETVKRNDLKSAYIRPLVHRGTGTISVDPREADVRVSIFTIYLGAYLGPEALEQGVDVCVSSWNRLGHNVFPAMAKIGGQYINSQLIKMEAVTNGFAEGIAIDGNGFVAEGSGENLFLVRDGVITTPPLASSILRGITRQSAITIARDLGYTVKEEFIPREMLYVADELFFTGTAAEVSPIRSVDRIAIGAGSRGPVTKAIQDAFFDLVSGDGEDPHGWLTPIA